MGGASGRDDDHHPQQVAGGEKARKKVKRNPTAASGVPRWEDEARENVTEPALSGAVGLRRSKRRSP